MLPKKIALKVIKYIKEYHSEDNNEFIKSIENNFDRKVKDITEREIYSSFTKWIKYLKEVDIAYLNGESMPEQYLEFYKIKYFSSLEKKFIMEVTKKDNIIYVVSNKLSSTKIILKEHCFYIERDDKTEEIHYSLLFNDLNVNTENVLNIVKYSVENYIGNLNYRNYERNYQTNKRKIFLDDPETEHDCYISIDVITDIKKINNVRMVFKSNEMFVRWTENIDGKEDNFAISFEIDTLFSNNIGDISSLDKILGIH